MRPVTLGFAMTGSFCTHAPVLRCLRQLRETYPNIVPILSENAYFLDSRFGPARDRIAELEDLCGRSVLKSIPEVEPLGPGAPLDLLIVAPCTGNTLAKLAAGIADTAVTFACKAHLRNARPVLLSVSTNDGFACRETKELMPAPISYAHNLTRALTDVRRSGRLGWLRPDGKSQVSVQYGETGEVERIDTVVISTQHSPDIAIGDLREAVIEEVIKPNLPSRLLDGNTRYLVNPTGRFVIGGPVGDSGLTGRKIIVDTYGGYAAHGGGAFSGKDPTKVDRSAAYMARYIAKNIVAAGLADKCQLELAYAIGVAQPVSVLVETYGTGRLSDEKLAALVERCFDLRPAAIISALDLRRPIYQQTAAYGHFGRPDLDLPWERTDRVEQLLGNQ